MLIDNQVPTDIRDIKLQMAALIARELNGVLSRAQSTMQHTNPAEPCGFPGDAKVLHYANAHPEEANQHHDRRCDPCSH